MKRHMVLAPLLALALAPAAEALQWKVTAAHSARIIPRPEPQESKLLANGFHQTLLTQISAQDLVFPIQFRVEVGKLMQNASPTSSCSTGWTWAANTLLVTCMTADVVDPCEDGWWQASTRGKLQWHPQGGIKDDVSQASFIDCDCT